MWCNQPKQKQKQKRKHNSTYNITTERCCIDLYNFYYKKIKVFDNFSFAFSQFSCRQTIASLHILFFLHGCCRFTSKILNGKRQCNLIVRKTAVHIKWCINNTQQNCFRIRFDFEYARKCEKEETPGNWKRRKTEQQKVGRKTVIYHIMHSKNT